MMHVTLRRPTHPVPSVKAGEQRVLNSSTDKDLEETARWTSGDNLRDERPTATPSHVTWRLVVIPVLFKNQV